MLSHLDDNAGWVVLVYAIALSALLIASAYTFMRTRRQENYLEKLDDTKD